MFSEFICHPTVRPSSNLGQRFLWPFKTGYKSEFMHKILSAWNRGLGGKEFQQIFIVNDALCTAAKAWANVLQGSLINGEPNLKPLTIFRNGDGEIQPEFSAYHLSEEKTLLKIDWQKWKSCFLFLRWYVIWVVKLWNNKSIIMK